MSSNPILSPITDALSGHAREALRASESRYRRLFETAQDGILLLNVDTAQIEDVNPYLISLLGYSHAEFLGKKLWEVGPFADRAESKEMFAELQTKGYVRYDDLPLKTKAGARIQVEFVSNTYDCEGIKVIQCNIRNITERKTAEAKIQRHTQLYAALSQCNTAIVHCTSEEELFLQICRAAVQFGGMKMAWVGLVDPDSRMVRPVTSFGDDTGYLKDLNISVDADSPLGGGPTGTAIRENQPFWCQDFINDPVTVHWRERAASAGWAASASLPLHRNDMVVGAFTLYSDEADSFDKAARDLLVEMATDISFALDNFTRESQRKQAEEDIRFKNTILLTQQETSPDAILVVDENSQIISYNQQFIDLWQLSPQLLSARLDVPVFQSVVDQVENSEAFVARVKYLYAHRDDKSREEIPLKDGRIVDRYSAPITGTDGKYYGRVWYFRDITERKQAERELRESERRFSDMLENVELISMMLDREARITYCNEYLLRLSGWRREEVIGQNWFELFIPPEINDLREEFFAALLANQPEALHHENEILTRSGGRRLIRWNNSVLRSGAGDVIGTASIGEDITERKMAEEVLKQRAAELERFHRLSVGRELQMIELKKQINELAIQAGQKPPFDLAFLSAEPVRTNPDHEKTS
jgi:PAS domain S-box-containing protein